MLGTLARHLALQVPTTLPVQSPLGAWRNWVDGEQGLIVSNFFLTLTLANPYLPMKHPCSPSAQFRHAPGCNCKFLEHIQGEF